MAFVVKSVLPGKGLEVPLSILSLERMIQEILFQEFSLNQI